MQTHVSYWNSIFNLVFFQCYVGKVNVHLASMHPLLSKQEISQVLTKTKPSILFCAIDEYERIDEVLKEMQMNIKVVILDGNVEGLEAVEELFIETGTEKTFEYVRFNDSPHMFL